MFIISVNDHLCVKPTRELAAEVAIKKVQKIVDDYKDDVYNVGELEEAIDILQRWVNRELSDGYIDTKNHRVDARLNYISCEPGLRIHASYLSSGRVNIIIQAEPA
jgi:hypothetical protein